LTLLAGAHQKTYRLVTRMDTGLRAGRLHAPCQFFSPNLKSFFVFYAITLDLIGKNVILNVMKVKVRKTGIFSKARPHKRVNKILPRRQKHKKKLDLS
jgi:hypothetical protein